MFTLRSASLNMMRAGLLHVWWHLAIAAFSIILLTALSAATTSPDTVSTHWTVVQQPTRLVNGSPVLFRVTTPKTVRMLSGSWLGHAIEFSLDTTDKSSTHSSSTHGSSTDKSSTRESWFALAGVSLETKPGTYPLALHGEINSARSAGSSVRQSAEQATEASSAKTIAFEKNIRIANQHYPIVPLKVPDRYTAPSPEDQGEIEKDKGIKTETFKTVTPEREWQGSFAPPVTAEISDVFGVERVFNGSVQSTHQGLDFRVPSGTSVAAVNRGRVILAQPLFFEGNCVVIDHGQGLLTLYLHLSKFLVREGDEVSKGQPIGLSGGTGRATGPHLHLAVRWQGEYLDPQALLKLQLP
jgi:murein DD-endopeptidase MepM/ murein hydrolase activator NlpD